MEALPVILISLIFSVFFSGMDIAFASAGKLRLEPDKNLHPVYSRILSYFIRNPGQYHTTMMAGHTVSLVVYAVSFAILLEPVLSGFPDMAVLVMQTLIAALIILVTSEILTAFLFRLNPALILRMFAIPLILFYFLFYPVARLFTGISGTLHVLRQNGYENHIPGRSDPEQQEDGVVQNKNEANGIKLFRNAMDFSKVKLREIMVPRTEMVVLDIHSGFDELRQRFIDTGYSRILFYEDSIDNIIGYIHHSTIFSDPESIRAALKSVLIVPETMSARKLLNIFIQQHRSIAIVMDEFGGTSGVVTSEDILEEIFGEIEDEHDTIDWVEKQISADEYIFSARIDLDLINEKYNLGFPLDENYETLAGYILFHHESIPKVNTLVTIDRFRFKILKATSTRIELVHLKLLSS